MQSDLQIVEDLFLATRCTNQAVEVLQAILHHRYKLSRAIVVTSMRAVRDWGKYLVGMTMASTILDRLRHRCKMHGFEDKSYRLKVTTAPIAIHTEPS